MNCLYMHRVGLFIRNILTPVNNKIYIFLLLSKKLILQFHQCGLEIKYHTNI